MEDVAGTIVNTAKDAFYVTVGLGVMGFQKAQVRRQEFKKKLEEPWANFEAQLDDVRVTINNRISELDSSLEAFISDLEERISPLEDKLPEPAREFAKEAHAKGKEIRGQILAHLTN